MGEQQHGAMWMFLKNFSNKFSIPDFVNGNDKRGELLDFWYDFYLKCEYFFVGSARKHISYDRIGASDKTDFLSSSNPNLLDIVGKEDDLVDPGGDDDLHPASSNANSTKPVAKSSLTSSNTTPSISSIASSSSSSIPPPPTSRFGSIFNKGGRTVDFNLKTKKFVFPNRVPSYQEEEDREKQRRNAAATTNITENMVNKDANWLETEDDDDESVDGGKNYEEGSSCSSDYEDDEDETGNGTRCGICGCEKKYEVVNNGGQGGPMVKFN